MLRTFVLLLAIVALAQCRNRCKSGLYPPDQSRVLKTEIVDLDAPPAERWGKILEPLKDDISTMIDQVVNLFPAAISGPLIKILDKDANKIADRFPAPYGDEIKGIASSTGLDLGKLILYNIFYEVFGACTSIVAQDPEGVMYHARNLDFGLLMGIDWQNKTWIEAENLRKILINVDFQRNNQTQYKGAFFGGYVGCLTCVKPSIFSVTVNTRFDNQYDSGLIKWFEGDSSGSFLAFLTRTAMETVVNYDDAFNAFNNTKMVGPGYIILGGAKPGQGAVFTREQELSLFPVTLEQKLNNGSFYLLQTNYDHWKPAPWFDDRRDPGDACMDQKGQKGLGFASLFNMLSSEPNLNQLTTYTSLINIQTGELMSARQRCVTPCTPW